MKKIALFLLTLPAVAFAQVPNEPPLPNQGFQMFVMLGIILLFFYFMIWRPEQKRRQALDNLRNSMKKGDKVTAMGIVGTVVKIQDQTVILRMVDGSKIEMLKGAISEVIPSTEEEQKQIEKETKV